MATMTFKLIKILAALASLAAGGCEHLEVRDAHFSLEVHVHAHAPSVALPD